MRNQPGSQSTRQRLFVTGVVQGVGFRPFVYGLARRYELSGFVGNNSAGVFIEVEGNTDQVAGFHESLRQEVPPLAYIESITAEFLDPLGETDFKIVQSSRQDAAHTLLSPDVCVCEDCLRETLDPHDRRYRYPFTNCTNCGPRFTIIRDIPYDRPLTTMASFKMCDECQREYDDPLDRRFHAQPNACPVCGPQIWLEYGESESKHVVHGDKALKTTQELLAAGKVVAVKGLGGFHLACNALDDAAVLRLRERKGRVDKPFAVMALDLDTARQIAEIGESEASLLMSRERPIVLVKKRAESPLSELVAPGNQHVGVMLPYTPLHYLLLGDFLSERSVLVMTSGNYSDEPIVRDNEEAQKTLSRLADAFLFHNRDIEARCDDSVLRAWRGVELPVRRSRGYVPFPVGLPFEVPSLLAVGGELKATFCLTADKHAYLSQHIGDMENLETLEAFEAAVHHYSHIFRVEPEAVACDLHPGYLSTRWALEQDFPTIQIQHHHAHIAAVMAENLLPAKEPVIGFSFDGTGYGTDGAIWGGEVLVGSYDNFERVAHLSYAPLPGGDAAIKRPYRLALAYLWSAGLDWDERLMPVQACGEAEQALLRRQLEAEINLVANSSMGRLFDVVASLAGVRQIVTYEAQAAVELESMTATNEPGSYEFVLSDGKVEIAPLLETVVRDVLAGIPVGIISARFHNAVAGVVLTQSLEQRRRTGINKVALSGGVFQNVTLLDATFDRLDKEGFQVLVHHKVPPNDGGLALGQAIIAAHRIGN